MVLKVCMALLLLALALPGPAGAAQPVFDASNTDVVLVIDNSGSMKENDPAYLRLAAAKLFIDLADPRDKIGIVVMSDRGRTRPLTKKMVRVGERAEVDELKGLIEGLRKEPMGNETHMGSALSLAYDLLDATPGSSKGANQHQFVVLLSDGLPTGAGQTELVDQAGSRFRERRYWKVFSIALGAEADPAYLKQAVAGPSGGEVIVAQDANQLLDSYLDIYARAGDDRYIDRVTVQPNALVPLADVRPDHQPVQMSVVLVRGDSGASISGLLAPDESDVVQPYYQNSVRRGAEPEYELYTVPPEAQVALAGRWMINIERPDQAEVTVAVLSRSRLRMRMPAPAPMREDEDGDLRYHPVGRPLLAVVGAQVAERNQDQSLDRPYIYNWVTGMAPVLRTVAPVEGPPTTLLDDGRAYDAAADDGRYSGLLPALEAEGDYTLRLEVPGANPAPIHVGKEYVVRVAALPVMMLTLPPAATTLPIDAPFSALIDLPGRADFTIDGVSFPVAHVERPDGLLDPLTITEAGDGRFRFSYTPNFAGAYRISIAAEVRGRGPMGEIRYMDYVEGSAAVPEAVPILSVSAAFTETLVYDREGVLHIPLTIDSRSPQEEPLQVEVVGLPGSRPIPEQVLLPPNEVVQRTISVRLPDEERPDTGQVTIALRSPEQRVIVRNAEVVAPFEAPGSLLRSVVLGLGAVAGGGFFFWRRRRRRKQVVLAPGAPRRLA